MTVKWTVKILSNFVAFLENMNFTKYTFYSLPCKYFKGLSWNEVICYTWAFKRPFVSFQMNGFFSSSTEKNHWNNEKKNPSEYFKWPIFTQKGKIGTCKNPKSRFFLLGWKYTLRICFESKNFLPKSCPDLLKNWVPDCSAQGRILAKTF